MNYKTIPTKWQFLRDATRELGIKYAPEVADEIDELLKITYPDIEQLTDEWIKDCIEYRIYIVDKITPNIILNVAHDPDSCIACQETGKYPCDACKFKIAGGSELVDEFSYYINRYINVK